MIYSIIKSIGGRVYHGHFRTYDGTVMETTDSLSTLRGDKVGNVIDFLIDIGYRVWVHVNVKDCGTELLKTNAKETKDEL